LAFAIEWLNLAFDFYDICYQIYYEPKRRLAPRARVKATEVGTRKFIALIGQIQPINFDLLGWARDAIGDIAEGEPTIELMKNVASSGGSLEDLEELEELGCPDGELIRAAALGANVGLVRSLYEHVHDVSKEELMELAIRTGNVDFCAAVFGDITGMKKKDKGVRLRDGRSAVEIAAEIGSVNVCLWAIMNGTAGFDPYYVFTRAAKYGRTAFLVWFHRLYGDALSLLETQALLRYAIVVGPEDKDLATLEFCLETCNCPRDGARKLRWALEIAVSACNMPAALWLHDRGAIADPLKLYRACIEAPESHFWVICPLEQFMELLDKKGFSFVLAAKQD
jgi:hypothetical protein